MKPLLPGDPAMVGRYEIEGRLGSGGMGTVYLGRTRGGRPAAVKVLDQLRDWDPQAVERFRREAETLRRINSAFTAELIDGELTDPPFWLATEYIPGPTLADAIEEDGPVTTEQCLWLIAALAEGLGDIHAYGICHRDVKPHNIILSLTGPQLIDFGIARGPAQSRLTKTGITIGTPNYTAPELLDDEVLTPAVDIFGLGATMAYAATGRRPYGSGTLESVWKRLFDEEIDLDGVDPHLAVLLRACVARAPRSRPTVDQIIEHCRRGLPVLSPRVAFAREKLGAPVAPAPPVPLPVAVPVGTNGMAATRNSGRRRTLAVVWSTVLALLLGGGTMATQRYLQEEDRAEQTAWVMSPAQSRPSAAPSVRPSKPSPPSSPTPASLKPKRTAPKTTPPPRSATPKHSRSVVAAPRTGQIKDSRGECADNNSSSTEDGNRLQVVPCNDTTAQLWTVRRDSRIEVQGRCMTVAENATAHGSRVVLFRCGTAVAQLWQSRADGTLVNPASDRCLDVLAESDTALVLHDCVGRPSQQWRLPAAT